MLAVIAQRWHDRAALVQGAVHSMAELQLYGLEDKTGPSLVLTVAIAFR